MNQTTRIAMAAKPEDAEAHFGNYFRAFDALGAALTVVGGDVDPADYDGLLLPGGGDIEPARYGQENRGSENIDPALDELQFSALRAFVRAGRPVLGICRGAQVVNVAFGGTLIQHLPASARHVHHPETGDSVHGTTAALYSFIGALYGEAFPVNSSHHQAADALGEGLRAVQWSDDGVIEALQHRSLPVYAVQWHPERMGFDHRRDDTVDGAALLRWFVGLCEAE